MDENNTSVTSPIYMFGTNCQSLYLLFNKHSGTKSKLRVGAVTVFVLRLQPVIS